MGLMHNLKDYIFVINTMSKELCSETVEYLKTIEFDENTFYNPKTGVSAPKSGDSEAEYIYAEECPTKDGLMQAIWDGLLEYHNKYRSPWYDGWNGYSSPRFNRYKETKEMALHCDHIHTLFDGEIRGIPILTCIGLLNDDFAGGEFVLFDDYSIDLKQGNMIFFPSVFLYPHKVNPVTKGERYSFASWSW